MALRFFYIFTDFNIFVGRYIGIFYRDLIFKGISLYYGSDLNMYVRMSVVGREVETL